jgi:methionyl-tRNA formyltransferase
MRRVLFIGQKRFGEDAWEMLRKGDGAGYRIVAVSSNASAERVWWQSNRIFETRDDLPFIDNAEKNEDLLAEAIAGYGVDTILCVQHSWILTSRILQAVNYEALNFHNAKLPEYRGYNAINHAILNGDSTFTCTAHWIADEVDRGDIALEASFDITPEETAIGLYARSHHAGLRLSGEVISRLGELENLPRRKLAGAGRFYSRNSIVPLREIKEPLTGEAETKARAFFFPPFEPAYFRQDGRKFYVLPTNLTELGFKMDGTALGEMIAATRHNFTCQVS